MARGITQEQVNGAADAILGAGENPTVEKVRATLGTGSPNTVTRMLDAWRGQLGTRLRQLSALPELPGPVGQAMIELWRLAGEHAEQALAERFLGRQATLEAAQAQLARERENWEARLQAAEIGIAQAQTARDLGEHTCATLTTQLRDSHALRADLALQRDRLQAQYDQLSTELQGLRAQLVEHQQAATKERAKQEAYVRNLEDRAHQEVDRLRQEAKQWQQRLEATERTHLKAETAYRTELRTLRDQLRSTEKEVVRYAKHVVGLEKALSKPAPSKPKRAPKPDRAQRAARAQNEQI